MSTDDVDRRLDALEREVADLRELTSATDEQGREWSIGELVSQFGLTRRQALLVIGLLASGNGLLAALTRSTSAQSNADGTIYVDQIGDSSNPVSNLYVDNQNNVSSSTTISGDLTVTGAVKSDSGATSPISVEHQNSGNSLSIDGSGADFGGQSINAGSVNTERTVIGSDGTTTAASVINQAIQNTPVGGTVMFSGEVDGQVVLDKDVNLIGSGAQLNADPADVDAGPFASTGVNGTVIDTTGSSDAALHIKGFRKGIVVGRFGVRSGTGSGVRTDQGVGSEVPRLFWSDLKNIYVYAPGDGEWGFNVSNTFKTNFTNCHVVRTQNGIRVANEESDGWHYGHNNYYNCFVDINRTGGQAYRFETVQGQLDYQRLYGTHAISEGPVTSDWTAYYFDEVFKPSLNSVTAEACDTTVYARLTSFDSVCTFANGAGDIDDGRDNVYLDATNRMTLVNNGYIRNNPVPETHTPEDVTANVSAGQAELNQRTTPIQVTAQVEKSSGTSGRLDTTLAVNTINNNLTITDKSVDGKRTTTTSDRINYFLSGRVAPQEYYQINIYGDGSIGNVVEIPIA